MSCATRHGGQRVPPRPEVRLDDTRCPRLPPAPPPRSTPARRPSPPRPPTGASSSRRAWSAGGPTCTTAWTASTPTRSARRPAWSRPPPARSSSARTTCTASTCGAAWSRTGSSGPRMLGYAAYADRFAGDLAGVAERAPLPRRARRHLPAPDAAAASRARGRTTAATRWPTTARCARDLGTMADLRDLARTLRGHGISLVLDLVLNHVADASTSGRCGRARGEQRYRDYFHVYPDRQTPDALRADACRRCSRTSRRAASPGTTTSTAGCGPRSTPTSGTWTGRTPTCSASTSTSCSTWPTRASRCSGSTRSRSCGSGWAPPARTSPRCTR